MAVLVVVFTVANAGIAVAAIVVFAVAAVCVSISVQLFYVVYVGESGAIVAAVNVGLVRAKVIAHAQVAVVKVVAGVVEIGASGRAHRSHAPVQIAALEVCLDGLAVATACLVYEIVEVVVLLGVFGVDVTLEG